jgi:glycosyltransferase involved in cell wall biosynthesis
MSYKSAYVWPNLAFPFRVYFESEKLRIFIIENLQHNFEWIQEYKDRFRSTDYFIVILGSHWSKYLLDNALDMFEYLSLDKSNFYILFNDERDKELFAKSGFAGDVINQNAWLDYNLSMKIIHGEEKFYDAIYVGRLIAVKRHYLASKVNNMALISGRLYGNNVETEAPPFIYRNEDPLSPDDVCKKINQSHCGLILSAKEGACFASSEYLLCGVPVVSTRSEGGRSIWYDEYNSIECADDEDEIESAVNFFKMNPRDPQIIRERHIAKANYFRAKFTLKLAELFVTHNVVGIDPYKYFSENFTHKLRKSYKPNFDEIFNRMI